MTCLLLTIPSRLILEMMLFDHHSFDYFGSMEGETILCIPSRTAIRLNFSSRSPEPLNVLCH